MIKLLIMLISDQASTDIKTHTRAQIITDFAFFVFSSCPLDSKYMIPPSITAKTAKTATYLIPVAIRFPIILNVFVSHGHGSHPQLISGTPAARVLSARII